MKIKKNHLGCLVLVLLLMGSWSVDLFSQSDKEPSKKKQKARMYLDYFSINNKEQKLVATVKTKVEGYFQNVSGANIHFYKGEVSEENLLGSKETDENGKASVIIMLKEGESADTSLWSTYLAVLENDPNFKDVEKEVEVKKAVLNMTTEEVDSVRQVRIFVGFPDSAGNIIPAEEINIRVYVQRLFGLLPVSEEFEMTDEEGLFTLEFPTDLPGDENGEVTLVAQVDDHDEFGNLESRKKIPWGIPLQIDQSEEGKELWMSSSNTPKYLVILVNLMLIGVLGVIIHVLMLLLGIKKLGKNYM